MSSGGSCAGNVRKVRTLRIKVQTMYTLTQDQELKQEYLEVKASLDDMLNRAAIECPDKTSLGIVEKYVVDEYAKYV